MTIQTAPYLDQKATWPASGRHILAQYDHASIIVYQAYRPAIGRFAVSHQRFGGDFSYNRMSWIKPKLPVDDVLLRLGRETRAGDHLGDSPQTRLLRIDSRTGGAVQI